MTAKKLSLFNFIEKYISGSAYYMQLQKYLRLIIAKLKDEEVLPVVIEGLFYPIYNLDSTIYRESTINIYNRSGNKF